MNEENQEVKNDEELQGFKKKEYDEWEKRTLRSLEEELIVINAKKKSEQLAYIYSRLVDFIVQEMKERLKKGEQDFNEISELDSSSKMVIKLLAESAINLTTITSGVHPTLWCNFLNILGLHNVSKTILKKNPPAWNEKMSVMTKKKESESDGVKTKRAYKKKDKTVYNQSLQLLQEEAKKELTPKENEQSFETYVSQPVNEQSMDMSQSGSMSINAEPVDIGDIFVGENFFFEMSNNLPNQ